MCTDYGFFDLAERMYGLRIGTDYGFFELAERMYGLRMGTDYGFFELAERLPAGRDLDCHRVKSLFFLQVLKNPFATMSR